MEKEKKIDLLYLVSLIICVGVLVAMGVMCILPSSHYDAYHRQYNSQYSDSGRWVKH